MKSPETGLRQLGEVLDPAGAIHLMLYGKEGRAGVYLLQDVCRRMGLEQDADGIAMVRHLLAALPKHHYVNAYLSKATDVRYDAGLVDTFLHAQDTAFSVPEVLALVARAELEFQAWHVNGLYYPEFLPPGPVRSAIERLPEREQWAVMEKIHLLIAGHLFLACRRERDPRGYRITFDGAEWLSYYPVPYPLASIDRPGGPETFRAGDTECHLAEAVRLYALADGQRTVQQILQTPWPASVAAETRVSYARDLVRTMWRVGRLFMSKVPVTLPKSAPIQEFWRIP
jgi:hypothetical protein